MDFNLSSDCFMFRMLSEIVKFFQHSLNVNFLHFPYHHTIILNVCHALNVVFMLWSRGCKIMLCLEAKITLWFKKKKHFYPSLLVSQLGVQDYPLPTEPQMLNFLFQITLLMSGIKLLWNQSMKNSAGTQVHLLARQNSGKSLFYFYFLRYENTRMKTKISLTKHSPDALEHNNNVNQSLKVLNPGAVFSVFDKNMRLGIFPQDLFHPYWTSVLEDNLSLQ